MIELSLALVVVAVLARDGFRAWLKHRATLEVTASWMADMQAQLNVMSETAKEAAIGRDTTIKLLAEDWRKKFAQLEAENKKQREYIDTQVAGTIAQLPNTGRGFGR